MNSVRAALLCIICVTLFAPARLQQCSSSLIAWPPEQCTRSCPERIDCNRQESIRVRKGDVEYCCVCVEYGIGTYESKLCPASALPKPQSPQVRYNATIDISKGRYEATLSLRDGEPAYVNIKHSIQMSLFSFLAVGVIATPVQVLPEPGTTMACGDADCETTTTSANSTIPAVVESTAAPPATTAAAGTGGNSSASSNSTSRRLLSINVEGGEQEQSQRLLETSYGSAAWRWPFAFEDGAKGQVTDMALQTHDLRGQRPESGAGAGLRAAWKEEEGVIDISQQLAEQARAQQRERSARSRAEQQRAPEDEQVEAFSRRASSGSSGRGVDWYVQGDGVAVVDSFNPLFLFQARNTDAVYIIEPSSADYGVSLIPTGDWTAQIEVAHQHAIELRSETLLVEVPARGRVFTVYSPPHDGIAFLKVRITSEQGAKVRIWVGVNSLATARSWEKWVDGTDAELNAIPDMFFTSLHMQSHLDMKTASWTLESDRAAVWELDARTAPALPLKIDNPYRFTIDADVPAALFVLDSSPAQDGRLFFQIMPGVGSSVKAYQRWEDLQAAVKLMAVTRVKGEISYYQLSDWGYTSDGTAGLQVMVSYWDPGAEVYLHVYLKRGAPSGSLTVVCYHMGDAFDAWKWWFGGIIFALFIFCLARCILCRRRPPILFFRSRSYRSRAGPMGGEEGMGGEGGAPIEEATAAEPPPEKLQRVGALYRRMDNGNPVVCNARQETEVGGPAETGGGGGAAGADGGEEEGEGGEGGEGGEDSCIVCLDRAPDAILMECGHGGLCAPCGASLWNQGPGHRHCPMCRKPFTGVMKKVGEEGPDGVVAVEALHYARRASVARVRTGRRGLGAFMSRLRGPRREEEGGQVEVRVQGEGADRERGEGGGGGAAVGAAAGAAGAAAGAAAVIDVVAVEESEEETDEEEEEETERAGQPQEQERGGGGRGGGGGDTDAELTEEELEEGQQAGGRGERPQPPPPPMEVDASQSIPTPPASPARR